MVERRNRQRRQAPVGDGWRRLLDRSHKRSAYRVDSTIVNRYCTLPT